MTETIKKHTNTHWRHAAEVANIAEALLEVAKRYKRDLSVDAAYQSAAIIQSTIRNPSKN